MKRLRIAFVSESPSPDRAKWFRTLRARADTELHVVYLTAGPATRSWERAELAAPDVTHLHSLSLEHAGSSDHLPRMARGLRRSLDQIDPDVVIIPGWTHPSCLDALAWSRIAKVPSVTTAETWKPSDSAGVSTLLASTIRRTVLRQVDAALGASARSVHYLKREGARSVHLVHTNACDVRSIARATAAVQRSELPTVLFVGRLRDRKGANSLPTIARRLDALGVFLRVIGDGNERTALEREIGGMERVALLGPLPRAVVHQEMAAASVVVVPSFHEPWGVVVQEALAAGASVVTTSEVGCVDDLLAGTRAGRVVSTDPVDIAKACVSMATRPATRAEARTSAHRVTFESAGDQLLDALNSVVGFRARPVAESTVAQPGPALVV